ncbi:hypothetical protein FAZ69_08365 [Trinickia terrae]|uniref:Uncharacterized protein n=1 Tax=Trinickia terrae TaxID=2571161 RepID=A0A4U1I9J6_9BURK|nr:hypothetical protein [Trinickia terrae]TKC90152.1 hypothetical protein FAZ69_08365 [Trinickia terrae]
MADARSMKLRARRTTTWGNPPTVSTPRFVRVFAGILRRTNHVLSGVILLQLALMAGLLLCLTYGTTFSRIYASDGSSHSCEFHFLSRGNR